MAEAYVSSVESVRAGTIFASGGEGQKQYDRWSSDARRRSGQKPAGRSLAQMAGDLRTVQGGLEFRTA